VALNGALESANSIVMRSENALPKLAASLASSPVWERRHLTIRGIVVVYEELAVSTTTSEAPSERRANHRRLRPERLVFIAEAPPGTSV